MTEKRLKSPAGKNYLTQVGQTGGRGVDLWLRVSLVFSLHSPEQWDCRKVCSSEGP